MEDLESHRTLQITISVSRHGKSWKLMMHQQIYIYLLHDCFHIYFGNNTLTVGHGNIMNIQVLCFMVLKEHKS